jgi:hypothetical protein
LLEFGLACLEAAKYSQEKLIVWFVRH